MIVRVHPSRLNGEIHIPSSKSHFQRLLAAAMMAPGESELEFKGLSADVESFLQIIRQAGAEVLLATDRIRVRGTRSLNGNHFSFGESGLAARMLMPLLLLGEQKVHFEARGSLLKRNQQGIVDALFPMGVQSDDFSGFFPFHLQGPLLPGHYTVDASKSSQLVSGLLFALPLLSADSVLNVTGLVSAPYVDMSVQVLADFGIGIKRDGNRFYLRGNQEYIAGKHAVEADWSSAASMAVAALIAGRISLQGLNQQSLQADARIQSLIPFREEADSLMVEQAANQAFLVDLHDAPDLFPVLSALAVYSQGESVLLGTGRLLNKESNRKEAILTEFARLGVNIRAEGNALRILGGSKVKGGTVDAHQDHRMAMALALLGLRAEAPVVVQGAESVQKSYPDFWNHLEQVGVRLERIEA